MSAVTSAWRRAAVSPGRAGRARDAPLDARSLPQGGEQTPNASALRRTGYDGVSRQSHSMVLLFIYGFL